MYTFQIRPHGGRGIHQGGQGGGQGIEEEKGPEGVLLCGRRGRRRRPHAAATRARKGELPKPNFNYLVVVNQVVSKVLLTSKQSLRFSM